MGQKKKKGTSVGREPQELVKLGEVKDCLESEARGVCFRAAASQPTVLTDSERVL